MRALPWLNKIGLQNDLGLLINTLIPQPCRLCLAPCSHSTPSISLCPACQASLPDRPWRCYQCALPLASEDAHLCGECLQTPPAFTRTITACDYQAPTNQLILQFKYHRQLADGSLLCERLLRHIEQQYHPQTLPQALIAVPNHWRRQLQRGYNQAAWLTRHLSRELQIPQLAPLKRLRHTPSQQGLKRRERLRNLRHNFTCPDASLLLGRHLALIDDVVTTGATASVISQVLVEQGASRVDVWCLARTSK